MLIHLTAHTPKRFIRLAWLSLQPNGDVSFGLSDKTFISPAFKGRNFVFNAFNRVTAEHIVASDPLALEKVKNPHFTYHRPIYFHLKADKQKAANALWAGMCDVPIVLSQQDEMPWIRATTARLASLRSAGLSWTGVPTNDLPIEVTTEDTSIEIDIDFVRPNVRIAPEPWVWSFPLEDAQLRARASLTLPRLSTLSWFHSH